METPSLVPPGALVFVADLHLSPSAPGRTAAFLELLRLLSRPPLPAALYVLGDLFDVWLGNPSFEEPSYQPVLSGLRSLSRAGVAVTVFQGNRDYLLDGSFANRAEVKLVPEWLSLQLGPLSAYLCHGDRFPVGDRAHQRMRWVLRSSEGRGAAAVLPAGLIRGAARWLRKRSDSAGERRSGRAWIPPAVIARLFRGGYDVVIAGHIHRETWRTMRIDRRDCLFYTLGAWEERGSILVFDGRSLQFQDFPLDRPPAQGSTLFSRAEEPPGGFLTRLRGLRGPSSSHLERS